MNSKVKCTCGHSWDKKDSSKKDMYVCHECGKDNTMKDGGWLSKYDDGGVQPNYNESDVEHSEDFVGMGNDITGRNYSPAWGGQFQWGGTLLDQNINMSRPHDEFGSATKGFNPFYSFPDLEKKDTSKTLKINDSRKKLSTTNQPVRPNSDLVGGKYNTRLLDSLIEEAKKQKMSKEDIKNLSAMAFQETKWGKTDDNIGHVLYDFPGKDSNQQFINAYKEKMKVADRLHITDPNLRLQVYNGLGTVTPKTEKDYHGFEMQKIYGVPIPKEGINMRKNPLYGKQVTDIRDNVLAKNPEYTQYIDSIYKAPIIEKQLTNFHLEKLRNREPLDTFQHGGTVPGSVGFSYARTKGIPSNGPYAKKTKASAQDGTDVKQDNTKNKIDLKHAQPIIDPLTKKPAIGKRLDLLRESQKQRVQSELKPYDEVQHYINNAIKAADVTTDLMQIGNFIPNPIAQTVGEAGNWIGAGIDAYQTYDAFKNNNYGNALINAASLAIPIGLSKKGGYLRDMYNTQPGSLADDIARLGSREGSYRPVTALPGQGSIPSIKKGINTNKSILGALGFETYLDVKDAKEEKSSKPKPKPKTSTTQKSNQPTKSNQPSKLDKPSKYSKPQQIEVPYDRGEDIQPINIIPRGVTYLDSPSVQQTISLPKEKDGSNVTAQNGKEMQFYQNGLDWKPKSISRDGSVIEDDRGQWDHPGEITKINSNEITMQGVDYPVLGVSDTGDTQMMQPGEDYTYDGNSVTEYPMMQNGGKSKPIYVDDVNDPRLKSYTDSLNLYKHTLKTAKNIKNVELDFINKNKWSGWNRDIYNNNFNPPHGNRFINPVKIAVEKKVDDFFGKPGVYPIYKKPQQEVIVKPTTTRENLQPIQTNSKGITYLDSPQVQQTISLPEEKAQIAGYDSGAHSGWQNFYPNEVREFIKTNPEWASKLDTSSDKSIYESIQNLSESFIPDPSSKKRKPKEVWDEYSKDALQAGMRTGNRKMKDGGWLSKYN